MKTFAPVCPPLGNDLMAFLHGYFDESGKYEQNRIVSFCGFATSPPLWDLFEPEWEYLLRRYNISSLHLSKDSLKATPSALRMYSQFIQTIKKTIEKGFGISVHVPAFASMHKVAKRAFRDDPHYFLQSCTPDCRVR
jgi:hypothetical protein